MKFTMRAMVRIWSQVLLDWSDSRFWVFTSKRCPAGTEMALAVTLLFTVRLILFYSLLSSDCPKFEGGRAAGLSNLIDCCSISFIFCWFTTGSVFIWHAVDTLIKPFFCTPRILHQIDSWWFRNWPPDQVQRVEFKNFKCCQTNLGKTQAKFSKQDGQYHGLPSPGPDPPVEQLPALDHLHDTRLPKN